MMDLSIFLALSLTDPTLYHVLCLDIKTDAFNTMHGADNIILIYGIHYKFMNTVVPKMYELPQNLPDSEGTTTLFLTNVAKTNLTVPKTISWHKILTIINGISSQVFYCK